MTELHDPSLAPTAELASREPAVAPPAETAPIGVVPDAPPAPSRHARAGRAGAERVHQLIRSGRLYEQEHGLKRGRQRLRQLIELGKRYEQEHGLRPAPEGKPGRLSRAGREELMATLLECLVRMAKPSFRAELERLVAALPKPAAEGHREHAA